MKIVTKTGKEYEINWAGIATVDGALRFEIVNGALSDIFSCFSNPEETAKLSRVWGDSTTVYEGFTAFKTIDIQANGSIIVALSK